jgi:hypothetical protein
VSRPGRPLGRTLDPTAFDEEVVRRVIAGQKVNGVIRTVDQWEVIRRLAGPAYGYSDGQIAHTFNRYGLKRPRVSVMRTRRRLGIAALPVGTNEHTMPVPIDAAPSRAKALK